ncbi:MAG: HDOD domain-containing protein [Candidatus Auribacterota bacterium]
MAKYDIDALMRNVDNLPSLSPIVTRIISLSEDEECSIDDLVAAISQEPGFTSKVLRLANSAFFGYARQISRVERAVIILGIDSIRNIGLGMAVSSFLKDKKQPFFEALLNIWEESLRVADCAREMSRLNKCTYSDDVFIAGLLHDIGKIALIKSFPTFYEKINKIIEDKSISQFAAEKRVLQFTHPELGIKLAENWNFPEPILYAIKYHHTPYRIQKTESLPVLNIIIPKYICLARLATHPKRAHRKMSLFTRLCLELSIEPEKIATILETQEERLIILKEVFSPVNQ